MSSIQPQRSIFRKTALQHYTRGREQEVLPRMVAPPVFQFLWLLLGLFSLGGLMAWWGRVPTYTATTGMIVSVPRKVESAEPTTMAILFLPANQLPKLHPGQRVMLRTSSSDQPLSFTISSTNKSLFSPTKLRQQYGLEGAAALTVTQPSGVVSVNLAGSKLAKPIYQGSSVLAQVEVGSTRLISLLPMGRKALENHQ